MCFCCNKSPKYTDVTYEGSAHADLTLMLQAMPLAATMAQSGNQQSKPATA
jgi:hypothetical protein